MTLPIKQILLENINGPIKQKLNIIKSPVAKGMIGLGVGSMAGNLIDNINDEHGFIDNTYKLPEVIGGILGGGIAVKSSFKNKNFRPITTLDDYHTSLHNLAKEYVNSNDRDGLKDILKGNPSKETKKYINEFLNK